ncbi:sigma-70 family RNA polymerase sigma factor (plasmid) [Roseomonas sp. OT10]|uniref:sigma-70 family RNA polymerase sigma factor n=1 Tax=Roseomonas cutis TaxID=2897332 RepID=UPI001E648AB2|nr:sigma-70 family RNA polymerase sigma factor [Roseomonas sp. OT10]UFN51596.1 sigma-70 family RNA polymerase sigma factor [Roseomonas sp. OT10]
MDEEQRELVEGVVRTLRADYSRAESPIQHSRVELLIERRGLNPEACAALFRALSEAGIPLQDDEAEVGTAPQVASRAGRGVFDRLMAHRLLCRKEEGELCRRYLQGRRMEVAIAEGTVASDHATRQVVALGKEAFETLVECNMRLVYSVARRHLRYSSLTLEDLVQEGVPGLIRAVELFDHTRELKLSTYATWWIRQAITRAIVDRGTTIRFPVHVAEDMLKLRRAEDRFGVEHGRSPTLEEMAIELEWSQRRVQRVRKAIRTGVVSLEAALDDEGEGGGLISIIPCEDPSPEQVAIDRALTKNVASALRVLPPRTEAILKRRFGVDTGRPETLEEIGRSYNVTRERIRQIEAKGLRRLKHPRISRPLKSFVE